MVKTVAGIAGRDQAERAPRGLTRGLTRGRRGLRRVGAVRRLLRCTGGISSVEFAIILPVLMMFLFSIIAFGTTLYAHVNMENAAREAVRRINADKRSYLHYFLDYHKGQHEGLAALTIDDFRASRLQLVDPKPIPEDELRRTYEWMRSWDMIDDVGEDSLIDAGRQSEAHGAAAE